jgi:hypothetical protein
MQQHRTTRGTYKEHGEISKRRQKRGAPRPHDRPRWLQQPTAVDRGKRTTDHGVLGGREGRHNVVERWSEVGHLPKITKQLNLETDTIRVLLFHFISYFVVSLCCFNLFQFGLVSFFCFVRA